MKIWVEVYSYSHSPIWLPLSSFGSDTRYLTESVSQYTIVERCSMILCKSLTLAIAVMYAATMGNAEYASSKCAAETLIHGSSITLQVGIGRSPLKSPQ